MSDDAMLNNDLGKDEMIECRLERELLGRVDEWWEDIGQAWMKGKRAEIIREEMGMMKVGQVVWDKEPDAGFER